MHICFVIGAMNYSGAEKVLSIIAKELSQTHQVSVVLLQDTMGSVSKDGQITTYGAKAEGRKIQRIWNRWRNIRSVVKSISPDVVVAFGSVCNVNTIPSLFGTKIPVVVCERNDPVHDPRKASERLIRWILYRFASGYVFQTDTIRKYFSRSIQSKAAVIANPIIDSGIRWEQNDSKKIATVARLDDDQKDHSTMFRAFQKLSTMYPAYVLEIFGDGPDKQNYLDMISSMGMEGKIVLRGKSKTPLQDMVKAEMFLLTSRFEGMPNALMEALSIGMPCVSTDCGGGGAAALFDLTNSGTLVPIGDEDVIAQAMKELIEDSSKAQAYSSHAVCINEKLAKERIAEQWKQYLLSVANGRK